VGIICVAVGAVGVVVPILPTTPFIIVAALCFARSSERLYRRLVSNRVFGRPLCDYLEGRGVSWKVRVPALVLLWAVIAVTAFLVFEHVAVQIGLMVVALGVTVHIVLLRKHVAGPEGRPHA
jgi:uncharacterized membrane protein YbaN (DUF454 family)